MTDDPFLELVHHTLDLMNGAFLRRGDPYTYAHEFYHQFRKLWDRGIPVGMGLGHLLIFGETEASLVVVRRPDGGGPDEPIAAIEFGSRAAVARLAFVKQTVGYRYALAILVRTDEKTAPLADDSSGVIVINKFL
jgi:hypothetical protein